MGRAPTITMSPTVMSDTIPSIIRQGILTLHITPYTAGIVDYTVEQPGRSWRLSAALSAVGLACIWLTSVMQWTSGMLHIQHPLLLPAVASAALLYLTVQFQLQAVVRESILVLPGIGIQLTKYRHTVRSLLTHNTHSYCMTSQTFVPASSIHSILLNEGFHRSRVIYYLAIVVHGSSTMLMPFECSMPRLQLLQTVWNGILDRMPASTSYATGVK